jgi:hypothetical protein
MNTMLYPMRVPAMQFCAIGRAWGRGFTHAYQFMCHTFLITAFYASGSQEPLDATLSLRFGPRCRLALYATIQILSRPIMLKLIRETHRHTSFFLSPVLVAVCVCREPHAVAALG